MILLLLLLPAIQSLGAKFLSTTKTEPPATIRKAIKGCPSEGYFFERQQQPGIEPAPCYLCYCKSDEIAVCTLRDNARCEDENSSYHTEVETTTRRYRRRKHRRRLARSPGLMELFFKDGKNENMLKEMAETNDEDCTPKSSKSIGCPPTNWCTGCLVCDCDDDGIWRCHVMSFCEDQTSRANSTKFMKAESSLMKILAPAKKVKKNLKVKKKKFKEILKKTVQEKKTEKWPVNPNNNTEIPSPKKDTQTLKKSVQEKKTEKQSVNPNNNTGIPSPKKDTKPFRKSVQKKKTEKRSVNPNNSTGIPSPKRDTKPLKKSVQKKKTEKRSVNPNNNTGIPSPKKDTKPFKKSVQKNKTEKRFVNPKNNTEISSSKKDTKTKNSTRKIFKKRSKTASTTSTTTIKPVMPLISVKTKTSFLRKDKKDKVLVIKKYISTISPIESPELLKYKNDSRRLAQILYQHYEASSKETKKTKREIRHENRTGNKDIHELSMKNKAKYKYYPGNSKTVGDKILNMNPRPKYKKNNAIGRKPTNVKEHHNRNTKMKASKPTHKKKRHSFFDVQKELIETGTVSYFKREQKETKNKKQKPNYGTKQIRLVNLAYRKKRDVSLAMGDNNNLTSVGNEKENISIVNIDQVFKTPADLSTTVENGIVNTPSVSVHHVSKIPAEIVTNNEVIGLSLNNYAYTVDNIVLKNDSGSEIIESGKGYEPTFENINTKVREKTNIEITSTESPKKANDTLQTQVDFEEMLIQTGRQHLENNHTEVPTTPFDYILDGEPDKKDELKRNTDTPTITLNAFKESKNDTQLLNNTEKIIIMQNFSDNSNLTANLINRVHPKDDNDTIRTNFTKTKLDKFVITNDIKVTKKLMFRPQIHAFDSNVSKFFKYSPKNELVAIKYLKNIYSKLISNKNNKTRFSNSAVMKSICETFGPCKISSKKVNVINSKISQLVHETKKALNVIKTIKGFLQFIDDENNSTGNITEEIKFKKYVTKLNAILTDTYGTPRTEHEAAIIRTIKSNTNVFIHSVGKFAFILNDILKIIRSNKIKNENLKKRKIAMKKVIGPKVNREILHKIKRLFLKFNLLQNNFMHKMYQVLTDLDAQSHQNLEVDNSKYEQRERRYKTSVKKYMNKINYNLAKLKKFALKMGPRERKKRFVRDDDDAVEYLLTLIEYLLRLNNPVDSPPVTDGIDVLIEAIRRAPDIEPIKRSYLNETSTISSYAPVKELSQSSSESVDEKDENISFIANETEILHDEMSLEKWFNVKEPSNSDNKLDDEYKTTTTTTPNNAQKKSTQATITKYVDVEDIVFNGDRQLNVYMATYPTFENTEDPFSKEKTKPKRQKKVKSKNKQVTNKTTPTSVTKTKAQTKPEVNRVTENTTKSHFDLLNEEYENRLKFNPPTTKPIKVKTNKKQKKTKRPRVKHRTDAELRLIRKTDVSSITKELEEERTRKRGVSEEDNLRKYMISAVDDETLKSSGDESVSKEMSLLDGVYDEPFKSYFSPILD